MDDLTRIDGIGKATARKLAEAGYDSFEKLAHDGMAGKDGVKLEWIAEARALMHEVSQGEESPAPEGLAEAEGEMSSEATVPSTGQASGDTPAAEGPQGNEYDGKPPRPDDQDEGPHAGSPADSGAADPHKDDAEREAADLAARAGAAFAPPPQVKTAVMVTVTVTGPKRGRWRTGKFFNATPRTIEASRDDLARLQADPHLTVAINQE